MPPPSTVQQPEGDGPDDSSLRPVSSIRARFENLGKDAPATKPTPVPAALASKPPSRPISPAPKPDKLKDFKVTQDTTVSTPTTPSTPVVPTRPKEKPKVPPPSAQQTEQTAPQPVPLSTKPVLPTKAFLTTTQPPAVTVQPPLSPPKIGASKFAVGEHPALVDSISSPGDPVTPSRPQIIPPRSSTPGAPGVPPPRSPRQAKPPSPPPPRRSAEIRRDKDSKPPPPPAPRREKPANTERSTGYGSHGTTTPRRPSKETSPFNSPPRSPVEDEPPPQLPTRPRMQPVGEPPERPKSTIGIFDPPPVHHSVAVKKIQRGPETNGNAVYSQNNPDTRPGQAMRAQQVPEQPPRPASTAPPPRPQRPANSAQTQALPEPQTTPVTGRRLSSNPTPQQQLPLPPSRTHTRSKTMTDRSHEVAQQEPRVAAPSMAATRSIVQPATQPAAAPPGRQDPANSVVTYPDCSSTNRRPPVLKKGVEEISTKYDARLFDVCGENVVASGQLTRVWSITDGELIMSLAHTEGTKATAVAFKPAADPYEEGWKVWIGLSSGELMEVDVATHGVTNSKGNIHSRREVIKIYRHFNELWSLDELGTLLVWGPDETGVPNVSGNPHQSYKLPRDHTFSMVVGSELWHATGKEIRVFAPTTDGRVQFQVLIRPLMSDGAGDVSAGTLVKTQPGKVFFGHVDGKVSIYSTKDYSHLGLLNISTWKMNALAGVGNRIWVGYNSGKICVYDIADSPWTVLKEWPAHANPVVGIKCDSASAFKLDRMQVISLGADNKIKAWDGLLEDDWIEDEMKSKDTEYCDFDEIRTMVFTWNAGASTPSGLRYSHNDGNFFPELLRSSGAPDILVFGFQELVDLEDKTATAKRFLKVKKKDPGTDQERMSHQYRDWRDFLMRTLDDCMPLDDMYHLLHTAPLVGLFTCIFVKSSLRDRIKHLHGAEVKRGMGGLHGNKGATVVRFRIDDSSLCFVNCHLAAGQSQANARHNDIAEILDANLFPAERDSAVRIDSFAGGGDGSLVLDHELCILNGDLNYRIDTMSRDTVVGAVKQNNLGKLLERDQLLVARRRNPAFRLRAFEELPITFAPTYKYDVGTDRYDTSEKKRSPAWCDRLLFRGRGRVQQLDYRRHEVYVSDHRPVTGDFRLWVKNVKPKERARVWMESQQKFEAVRERETADEKLHYLMKVCGYDETTSMRLIKEKSSRKLNRSPSRTREEY